MVPLINQAIGKGIPVITFNTDCPTSQRFAWVGLSNVTAGAVAGTTFLKIFRANHPPGQGHYEVALMSGAPSAPFAVDRFNGFKSVISSQSDISLLGPFTVNFDPSLKATTTSRTYLVGIPICPADSLPMKPSFLSSVPAPLPQPVGR